MKPVTGASSVYAKEKRQAISEMAVRIVMRVAIGGSDGQSGTIISILPASVFEHALHLIDRLNLVKLEEENRFTRQLKISVENFTQHFATDQYDQLFDEVLYCFVEIADHFGDLCEKRSLFWPVEQDRTAIQKLCNIGYVEQSEAGYLWTDLCGPAFIMAGIWTSDLVSIVEIREAYTEKCARYIEQNLDKKVRAEICDPTRSWKTILLFNTLEDEKNWPDDPTIPAALESDVAKRIVEIVLRKKFSNFGGAD
ncbi:MAG: hypothetical protein GY750_01785 [Lentisphaerae bacterium]|nr:hypothetical protein [Lentisphaerota bacterium]